MSNLKYPKGEIVWTGYYNKKDQLLFILTSKPQRDYYYLYEVTDDGFKKLGRSKNPKELEEKFKVHETMKE